MDKGMIIVDKIPNCCVECDFCRSMGMVNPQCLLLDDRVIPLVQAKAERLPDCPIKEMPEKKNSQPWHMAHEKGVIDGWNDCIKAIGGN